MGGVVVEAGGVKITSDHALGAASNFLTLMNGTSLFFIAPLELNVSRTIFIGNGSTINNQAVGFSKISGVVTSGVLGGTLNFIGVPGSITYLANPFNNYLGHTSIQGGVLQINSDANLGSLSGGIRLDAPNSTLKLGGSIISNRILTINAVNTKIDTGTSTSLFSGQVVANQLLTVVGTGTLMLSNSANLYPNGILVQSGVLQGTTSSLNANNITLNPNATLVFDQASSGTFAQTIAGAGNIIKQNLGNLIISNAANIAANVTNVNAGRLSVNTVVGNPYVCPTVNVNPAGTLGGAGFITGNIFNNGIVAPGNSIGTLTVNGNYVSGSSGVTQIEVNSGGANSILNVTGVATVNGSVVIVPEPGVYPATGDYTFLITGGGVNGTFSSVAGKIGAFTPEITYVGNTAHVVYSRKAILRNLGEGNVNETAIGKYLVAGAKLKSKVKQ